MYLQNKFVIIFLSLLFLYYKSYSQELNQANKIGLGGSLFNISEYIYQNDFQPANSIYLTIDIGSKFRIEPFLGFSFNAFEDSYLLGLGSFYKKKNNRFNFLYGGRFFIGNDKKIGFSPSIGGEYYIIENFSIGSEIQIPIINDNRNLSINTQTSFIIRVYW